MLDERIPAKLMEEYGDSPDPAGCILEAVVGYTEIYAFQDIMDVVDFIESEDDCEAI